jgi:glycerophosphoryl diester phosphodiesterase
MVGLFPHLPRPLLFAHRGASAQAPENTLASFELGLKLGAHVLELDIHMTRDNEVVVLHDTTLDRTTNGLGSVRDKTFAELRELDAGYRFTLGDGRWPFRGQGCVIPRLEEVLRAFPKAGFNIELKQREPSIIRPVLDLLAKVGVSDVLLAAEDDGIMTELGAAHVGCGLGVSVGQVKAVLQAVYLFRKTRDFRGRALQIPLRDRALAWGLLPITTSRVIRVAHDLGMEVHLFVIDEPKIAARWLDQGADGIMSNAPGNLSGLFGGQGRSC